MDWAISYFTLRESIAMIAAIVIVVIAIFIVCNVIADKLFRRNYEYKKVIGWGKYVNTCKESKKQIQ